MINFHYETEFKLENEDAISKWVSQTILDENYTEDEINFIFCSDDYLHKINLDFLNHDTFTDIISFDYTVRKKLQGDVYISINRVKENATTFNASFKIELARVIVHGILHFCGYKDKTESDAKLMRSKEDHYIGKLF